MMESNPLSAIDRPARIEVRERGSVMVVALIILALLTIIGISASRTSEIDIQIAGNMKAYEIAFHHADSGVYSTPKVISACLDTGTQPDLPSATYYETVSGTSEFYREVMGYKAYDTDRDLGFTLSGYPVDIDVKRTGQKILAGGGVEFASGAEGVGAGSAGGIAVFFLLDSLGEGPNSARSNVVAEYRKVLGVSGGL
ncbi:MAG: PilX N-terminal domain-containing pilus assembly protein [Desulfatiglandales bacterium]